MVEGNENKARHRALNLIRADVGREFNERLITVEHKRPETLYL